MDSAIETVSCLQDEILPSVLWVGTALSLSFPLFGKPAVVLSGCTFKQQRLQFPRRGCIKVWTLAGVFSLKIPHSHQGLSEVLCVDEGSLKR